MKKTLFFLLGALLATMMPSNAQDQSYRVKWSGANATVAYSAMPATAVSATYLDENGVSHNATLSYVNEAGVTSTEAINAGVYQVIAAAETDGIELSNATTTLTITRRIVTVRHERPESYVETFKWWDGNDTAMIKSNNGNRTATRLTNETAFDGNGWGSIHDVYGNDAVISRAGLTYTTYALFNDATEEVQKSIVAYFELSDSSNFTLDTNAMLVSTRGVIVNHLRINENYGVNGNGLAIDVNGYCNTVDMWYEVISGIPTQYKVTFDNAAISAGFQNIGWTNVTEANEGHIQFPAAGVQPGSYKMTFELTNGYESKEVSTEFQVNLGSDLIRAIFTDVISIVDTCNCFKNYQWYHNGEKINGATMPYYQDPDGVLSGSYYLVVEYKGKEVRTCEQTNFSIITPNDNVTALGISAKAYPNPTKDNVTIELKNATATTHTLRVTNVMGQTILNTQFDGISTNINLAGYQNGTYNVSIDGVVIRVIKK